jgi:hypothetical protein
VDRRAQRESRSSPHLEPRTPRRILRQSLRVRRRPVRVQPPRHRIGHMPSDARHRADRDAENRATVAAERAVVRAARGHSLPPTNSTRPVSVRG